MCLWFLGDSDGSSDERPGTDSDSDVPLINLVNTQSEFSTGTPEPTADNILSLFGKTASALKGPEVHPDVSALLSGFLLKGVDKDNRNATLEIYPNLANCPALQPPIVNPEIKSCLDAGALKQDNFLYKLQLQLGAGISALAVPFDKQYEVTRSQATEDSKRDLEKQCDAIKIFADAFHALSLHRRHVILPSLDGEVRKLLEACPTDEFLFGKYFVEQLKNSKEARRLGSTIQKKKNITPRVFPKFNNKKLGDNRPSTSRASSYLNSKRPLQRSRMKKEEGRQRPRRPDYRQ